MLEVHVLPVGPFQANCYLLNDPERGEAIVVDPGDEAPVILRKAEELNTSIVEIWNTHGHFDHINANSPVKDATGAPISIHGLEANWLADPHANLASFTGLPFIPSKADRLWKDGDKIEALGRMWEIHHVPGHSPGQCAIVCPEEDLFVGGDLLMMSSIGRVDFPGCDPEAMTRSLRGLFKEWGKDEWRVLPGHGPETSIGRERHANPFVKEALEVGIWG